VAAALAAEGNSDLAAAPKGAPVPGRWWTVRPQSLHAAIGWIPMRKIDGWPIRNALISRLIWVLDIIC
jgi:hypothetical protein